jgi:hypothetical protein
MYWNHRMVNLTEDDESWIEICEVFYDDDHTPILYTEKGISVAGETKEELKTQLEQMLSCLNKPVLFKADFNNNLLKMMVEDSDPYTFD